jgi:(5-formylfuran-3-yl)methyl phosphate synthase
LLVSVRSEAEARAALAGGADVIDVKEPQRGPLGAADWSTIGAIVQVVNDRAMVSAAMGELIDVQTDNFKPLPGGVAFFKLGLAGCQTLPNWKDQWRAASEHICGESRHPRPQAVAVAYADWQIAEAPPPYEVLATAREFHCTALLVDTWDKSQGTLFDHWPVGEVKAFVAEVRATGLVIVLAGSLVGEAFAAAAELAPDLVAVRTAACDGGRHGSVSAQRVQAIKLALRRACAANQDFS